MWELKVSEMLLNTSSYLPLLNEQETGLVFFEHFYFIFSFLERLLLVCCLL